MKTQSVIISSILLFLSVMRLHASPIVFQFESYPGQSTFLSGSTITLAGPSDLTGVNNATDLLGFDILTPNGPITPGPGVIDTFGGVSIYGGKSPFLYSSNFFFGDGTLDITIVSNQEQIVVTSQQFEVIPSGQSPIRAEGTWSVVPATAVPDTANSFSLLLIALVALIPITQSSVKIKKLSATPSLIEANLR